MKIIFSTLLATSVALGLQAQQENQTNPADALILKTTSHDFGKIQQGRPVTTVFEITNTGNEPIALDNVIASCGCTTPEWSREAIKPGESTQIKVGYNAAAEGPFQKTVTIQYHGGKAKSFTITGTVFKSPATPAPGNSSITLLKQVNQS